MKLEDIEGLTDVEPLEKIKLKIDYERIRIDRLKTWLTALSIFVPLLAVAITVGVGVWSENQRGKTSFETKAIEIVLNASSPEAATNKAIVFSELFPGRLPSDFKEKMVRMYGKPPLKPE
jgi:hypothetical protein